MIIINLRKLQNHYYSYYSVVLEMKRTIPNILIGLLLILVLTNSFLMTQRMITGHTKFSIAMLPQTFDSAALLTAVAEAKPDDYIYGAVAAPSWALPLGAVLAILTAAIPILLRPGEKALDQQRIDEETTNNTFNKRRNKDL